MINGHLQHRQGLLRFRKPMKEVVSQGELPIARAFQRTAWTK